MLLGRLNQATRLLNVGFGNMSLKNNSKISTLVTRLNEAEKNMRFVMIEVKKIRRELNQLIGEDEGDNSVEAVADVREPEGKRSRYSFTEEKGYTVVFTDGACSSNGRNGAKAGIGVWWDYNHPLNVARPTSKRNTNNAAEIEACTEACKIAAEQGIARLLIKTDSNFVIKCMTEWMQKWKKNNWKTAAGKDVINKVELVELDEMTKRLKDVKYEHVSGHSGIQGNEEADKLAVLGATL